MSGTSFSPNNTPHMPGAVQTTTHATTQTLATVRSSALFKIDPSIIQSTSELLELSNGPNAQIIHGEEDAAAFSRVPLDAKDDEMIQRLPKRKRTGNGWSKNKKGEKPTPTDNLAITMAPGVAAEADPSKEKWAANLRRVVFEPSTSINRSKILTQRPHHAAPTQSPAHIMYFSRPEQGNNQNHPNPVTAPPDADMESTTPTTYIAAESAYFAGGESGAVRN
ncbi:hypothetical protein D9619_009178 [Psilocybe cf. subviscida]|uniref:Uncharacterized protein n=1 Tax=Psilocybe cf. subviscida TaxID=2480587 RepID=A0A8H5FAG6_9AGAR|nr:hypothetical protein D9619_009178 [Psilocybe cf. subviscida]